MENSAKRKEPGVIPSSKSLSFPTKTVQSRCGSTVYFTCLFNANRSLFPEYAKGTILIINAPFVEFPFVIFF